MLIVLVVVHLTDGIVFLLLCAIINNVTIILGGS